MNLDDQLESIEEYGQTEAEQISQQENVDDFLGDEDDIFGEDASENDLEHAYDSFMTSNEADFNGQSAARIQGDADREMNDAEMSSFLFNEGYHVIDADLDESQIIELEIEEGDIEAYLRDEKGSIVGFVISDEAGDAQSYLYASEDNSLRGVQVVRVSDSKLISLALSKDQIER